MFNNCASWVKAPRNMKHRRTGWDPTVLRQIAKVAQELPPFGEGGAGAVPFAPLIGNIVPVVVLHQIATARLPTFRLSLILSLSQTLMLCVLYMGEGEEEDGTGQGDQEEEERDRCPQRVHFLEWDRGGKGGERGEGR